jgi:hypothetical protein
VNDEDRILELSFENSKYFHFIADQNLKIITLQAENKKLREALMIYANAKGLVFTDKGLHLKDSRNGSSFELQEPARKALKEITPIE